MYDILNDLIWKYQPLIIFHSENVDEIFAMRREKSMTSFHRLSRGDKNSPEFYHNLNIYLISKLSW